MKDREIPTVRIQHFEDGQFEIIPCPRVQLLEHIVERWEDCLCRCLNLSEEEAAKESTRHFCRGLAAGWANALMDLKEYIKDHDYLVQVAQMNYKAEVDG